VLEVAIGRLPAAARAATAMDIQKAVWAAVRRWKFPKLKDADKPIAYVVFVPVSMSPQ
jgi:hypothetical protein